MATDVPVATEPPDPEDSPHDSAGDRGPEPLEAKSAPFDKAASGGHPALVDGAASTEEDFAEDGLDKDPVACLLEPEVRGGEPAPDRAVTKLQARYTTPPPSSALAYSIVKKKTSPAKKNMGSDSAAYCKEDPVQKAPDFEDKLLAEIDPVSIQISAQEFKGLLDGKDIPDADLARLKDFCEVDFSDLGSKAEDVRYDPLVSPLEGGCYILYWAHIS